MLVGFPLVLALSSVGMAQDSAIALVRDVDAAGKLDIVSSGIGQQGVVVNGARGRDKPESLTTCANALLHAARGSSSKSGICANRFGMTADATVSVYEIRILGFETDKDILGFETDKDILGFEADKKALRFVPLVSVRADGAQASAVLSGSFRGYTVRQYKSAKATYAVVGCMPADNCSSLGINHPEEVLEINHPEEVVELRALAAQVHGHVVKKLGGEVRPSPRR